jgi:ketosteroid isomerase-like protein
MRTIIVTTFLLCLSLQLIAQRKEAGTDRKAIKSLPSKDTVDGFANKDAESVKTVLKQFNSAVERLDVSLTEKLFTPDSKVYESGGSEGTFIHYLEHHLIPELKSFKSFKYDNYKVDVKVDGTYAFATESYNYTIVTLKENTVIKRKGVATSVLKKMNGEWKIIISHNSSRK